MSNISFMIRRPVFHLCLVDCASRVWYPSLCLWERQTDDFHTCSGGCEWEVDVSMCVPAAISLAVPALSVRLYASFHPICSHLLHWRSVTKPEDKYLHKDKIHHLTNHNTHNFRIQPIRTHERWVARPKPSQYSCLALEHGHVCSSNELNTLFFKNEKLY